MQLTPEQERLGKDNFHEAVAFTRRGFLVGAAAAPPTETPWLSAEPVSPWQVRCRIASASDPERERQRAVPCEQPVTGLPPVPRAIMRPEGSWARTRKAP